MKYHTKYSYLLHWLCDLSSVKPLYLFIDKTNWYIEESKENKYLTLVPADESKETLKIYEQIWNKSEIFLYQRAIIEVVI